MIRHVAELLVVPKQPLLAVEKGNKLAIGELSVALHSNNSWNAHQVEYRLKHPKLDNMTAEDYLKGCRTAYEARFDDLGEEKGDPHAQSAAVEDLMKWYRGVNLAAIEDSKEKGQGAVMLKKIAKPFIDQSRAAFNNYDVDIWGVVFDRFTDHAQFWGGSPVYEKVVDKTVVMERRDEENDTQQEGVAIRIDFAQHKGEKRQDSMRGQLAKLLMNLIYLVLLERGEEKDDINSLFKKGFPWKWADAAVKHQLRIINWPTELKRNFPSPGFDLSHIKEEDGPVTQSEALRTMHRRLKAIYQGQELDTESDDEPMDVNSGGASGSESDKEMELEDPREVVIVNCTDGTNLLKANACKGLIRMLDNRTKPKVMKSRKRKAADTAPDQDVDEREAKRRKDNATGKHKATDKVNERRVPPPSPLASPRESLSPPPSPPPKPLRAGKSSGPPRGAFPSVGQPDKIYCVYVNGSQISDPFVIGKFNILMAGKVPPAVYVDIWFYSPGSQAWKAMPSNMVPVLGEEQIPMLDCLRMNVGLF
ncbi:hypothetical protein C8R45DRAFT_1087621 [Mycena sanguinolenta]|nr:hypothetical protein C8R45DRAFT_1087621 [Mycena sanguinolenta]